MTLRWCAGPPGWTSHSPMRKEGVLACQFGIPLFPIDWASYKQVDNFGKGRHVDSTPIQLRSLVHTPEGLVRQFQHSKRRRFWVPSGFSPPGTYCLNLGTTESDRQSRSQILYTTLKIDRPHLKEKDSFTLKVTKARNLERWEKRNQKDTHWNPTIFMLSQRQSDTRHKTKLRNRPNIPSLYEPM